MALVLHRFNAECDTLGVHGFSVVEQSVNNIVPKWKMELPQQFGAHVNVQVIKIRIENIHKRRREVKKIRDSHIITYRVENVNL